MRHLLLIDNYDSFTFNIKSYFEQLQCRVTVIKNDEIDCATIPQFEPTHILLSPGPGTPADAGISLEVIQRYHSRYPLLGVCLGHQCIAEAFGGRVVKAEQVFHGKNSRIRHDNSGIFAGLPTDYSVTRYHSLVVDSSRLPDCLRVTATVSDKDAIMGLAHREYPVFGVQFHPEAILSEQGLPIFERFLKTTTVEQV